VCSVAGWPAVISRLKESSGREIVQQSTHVFRRRLQSSNFVLSLPFVLPMAKLDLSLASDLTAVGTALTDHFGRIGNEKRAFQKSGATVLRQWPNSSNLGISNE